MDGSGLARARPERVSGMVLGPIPVGSAISPWFRFPDQVVGRAGPLQAGLVAGNPVILGVGDGIEALGEAIAALTQRLAVAGDGEVSSVVARRPVDAVPLHEVQAALAGGQPLLLHSIHVAQIGEGIQAQRPCIHTLLSVENTFPSRSRQV